MGEWSGVGVLGVVVEVLRTVTLRTVYVARRFVRGIVLLFIHLCVMLCCLDFSFTDCYACERSVTPSL